MPSAQDGYTLDLDSTRLLHEDGHPQGGRGGYTQSGLNREKRQARLASLIADKQTPQT